MSLAGALRSSLSAEIVSAISSRSEDWRLIERSESPTWVRMACWARTVVALLMAASTRGVSSASWSA
ncbi:hypothetical protein Y695_02372 [Hydrogenophaga sp. T4]|nr:hypothetical protein Y695_02372 [Hydrogenophaga sp. T4]